MQKKILIVSNEATHPTIGGNRTCILSYSRMLKEMGYEVGFCYSFQPWWQPQQWIHEMAEYWKDRFHLHRQLILFDRINCIIQSKILFPIRKKHSLDGTCPLTLPRFVKKIILKYNYNVIILNYWNCSKILLPLPKNIRKIIYAHDKFSDRYKRTGDAYLSTDSITEGIAFDRADVILAIQQCEADFFKTITKTPVNTVYCYFPVKLLPLSDDNLKILFFSGPNKFNIDGLMWFISNVLPLVRMTYPYVQLLIGGKICSAVEFLKSNTSIRLLGCFNNSADFYKQGNLVINPVRDGSGLKIKTFEALSFGRNVICHPHSMEGVWKPEKSPIAIAQSVQNFAAEILKRISNPELLVKESQHAINYINEMNAEVKKAFITSISP